MRAGIEHGVQLSAQSLYEAVAQMGALTIAAELNGCLGQLRLKRQGMPS
jgi:hypothetical protein